MSKIKYSTKYAVADITLLMIAEKSAEYTDGKISAEDCLDEIIAMVYGYSQIRINEFAEEN